MKMMEGRSVPYGGALLWLTCHEFSNKLPKSRFRNYPFDYWQSGGKISQANTVCALSISATVILAAYIGACTGAKREKFNRMRFPKNQFSRQPMRIDHPAVV
jgi:hypothetical protein